MFGADIFGENIFGEQMFGGFFIKSPKISVNNFGEMEFSPEHTSGAKPLK